MRNTQYRPPPTCHAVASILAKAPCLTCGGVFESPRFLCQKCGWPNFVAYPRAAFALYVLPFTLVELGLVGLMFYFNLTDDRFGFADGPRWSRLALYGLVPFLGFLWLGWRNWMMAKRFRAAGARVEALAALRGAALEPALPAAGVEAARSAVERAEAVLGNGACVHCAEAFDRPRLFCPRCYRNNFVRFPEASLLFHGLPSVFLAGCIVHLYRTLRDDPEANRTYFESAIVGLAIIGIVLASISVRALRRANKLRRESEAIVMAFRRAEFERLKREGADLA